MPKVELTEKQIESLHRMEKQQRLFEEEDGHDLELLKKVVAEIMQDAQDHDYTCIDELLKDVPVDRLKGFLREYDE